MGRLAACRAGKAVAWQRAHVGLARARCASGAEGRVPLEASVDMSSPLLSLQDDKFLGLTGPVVHSCALAA